MSIGEWYAQRAGQRLNSRGGILGECVSLVQNYAENVLGVPGTPVFPVPFARLMAGARPDYFTWVTNTPEGVPPYGSIVVFNGRMGGGYGHTGVAIEGTDVNQVRLIQQNDPLGSGASIKVYNYNNVMGWLVPKSQAVPNPPQGGDEMMNQGENEYARARKLHQQVRGRDLARDVFNQLAGKITWLRYIEIVSDDPEANQHEQNATIGATAVKDNWQQQIYTLQDQNKELQGQVTSLAKQVKELQAQVGNNGDTQLLNSFGQLLQQLIVRLGIKK